MTAPFPLKWPAGRPRRRQRSYGPFRGQREDGRIERSALTVAEALSRLQTQLDLLKARYPVVSSNVEPRLDGRPRSGQAEPADPGVAVYFDLAGKPHCLPCDTYTAVAQNICAIAAHIELTRRIERHGVATTAEMFAGFLALSSPADRRPWREVLELHRAKSVTTVTVEEAFRRLARERHPDCGGSDAMMAELNRARDEAQQELRR